MTNKELSVLAMAAFLLAAGCGKDQSGSADASDKPPTAAELDKDAEADLAESNKAEAKEWLKAPTHVIFKGDKEKVVKFVDDFYAAGATSVYITGIEKLGGNEVTETMLVALPKDAAIRAKIFEVGNRANEEFGDDPDKDIGQKYLTFVLE